MARTPRPNPAGWFHVTNRGSRRWNIFLDDFDRERFLDLLNGISERFGIEVIAYALMGNHYHLLLHCKSPNLSEALHWLSCQYVKGFNKRHGYDGTLFRARFYSVEVKTNEQLLTVVRYIHRNPLDLNPDADLASYSWSSHGAFLGWRRQPTWLVPARVLDQFSNSDAFRRFVEQPLPSDSVQNSRQSEPATTSNQKIKPTTAVAPADIQRAVARVAGIEPRDLSKPRGYGPKRARLAALVLCVDKFAIAPRSLVDLFEFPSHAALASALNRARRQLETDDEFEGLVSRSKDSLTSSWCQAP